LVQELPPSQYHGIQSGLISYSQVFYILACLVSQ
jgi:hypothetical protein